MLQLLKIYVAFRSSSLVDVSVGAVIQATELCCSNTDFYLYVEDSHCS